MQARRWRPSGWCWRPGRRRIPRRGPTWRRSGSPLVTVVRQNSIPSCTKIQTARSTHGSSPCHETRVPGGSDMLRRPRCRPSSLLRSGVPARRTIPAQPLFVPPIAPSSQAWPPVAMVGCFLSLSLDPGAPTGRPSGRGRPPRVMSATRRGWIGPTPSPPPWATPTRACAGFRTG